MVFAFACRNIEKSVIDRGECRDAIETRRVLDTLDWLLGGFNFSAKSAREPIIESNPPAEWQNRQSPGSGSLTF
jgi:hypothetical protein